MKSQLNKILKFTLVILLFSLSKSYSVEDLSEFTDAISEAREGFDKVSAASTEQSKIIDEAFKEIDKATSPLANFVNILDVTPPGAAAIIITTIAISGGTFKIMINK